MSFHKLFKFFLFFGLSLTFIQCATYTDEVRELRMDYVKGQYENSLEKLEKSSLKTSEKDRLLYHLEKSMILDRMDKLQKSRSSLFNASRTVDELYTTSISKTAASFVVSDSVTDYEGEDYEKVSIHTLLALSFLEEQKLKEARVEAKKINVRLKEITQDYNSKHDNYKEDAFARFLSGAIYESLENWDSAIIDYRKALEIYSSGKYSRFIDGPVPEALVFSLYGVALRRNRKDVIQALKKNYKKLLEKYDADLKRLPEGGSVFVFHETGQVEAKTEKTFVLPISEQIVRFSFPVIEKQDIDWANKQTGVSVNGTFHLASNVLNMNALAYQCLEDRRGRMILKSMARLLAKGQLTYQAKENFGPLAGLLVNIAGVVTESADTRSWSLLPQAFYVNRIRLEPGKHKLQIKTANKIQEILPLNIKANELKIFRSKS